MLIVSPGNPTMRLIKNLLGSLKRERLYVAAHLPCQSNVDPFPMLNGPDHANHSESHAAPEQIARERRVRSTFYVPVAATARRRKARAFFA